MRAYSTGCLSFFFDESMNVVYRELDFMGHQGYRVGTDGSLWSRGKIMSSNLWSTDPYPRNLLHSERFRRHELVLRAFVGPPERGQGCRHLNGNRTDNDVTNLCWGTQQENIADAVRHDTLPRGETHGNAKLTNSTARMAYDLYLTGQYTMKKLAHKFGVEWHVIWLLVHGKSWKHLNLPPVSKELLSSIKRRNNFKRRSR